jgi:molybdate transport system substrate-binding protein
MRIAAAADLQPVLPRVLEAYRTKETAKAPAKDPAEITVSYGSSATLATQIAQGAPFDLFLSADLSFPEKLVRLGLVPDGTVVRYARGTLVLWARNDAGLPTLSVDLLKTRAVASIAIANPEHAPYGRAAMASLTNLHLLLALEGKLRTAENIAQAAQFVESGNASVGLLSLTSAVTPRLRAEGHYVPMPPESYPPIEQGAVLLRHSPANPAARSFLEFLTSGPTQQSLAQYGLSPGR